MNYEEIKNGLAEFDKTKVDVYLTYIHKLMSDPKNSNWKNFFNHKQAIALYKKVAIDGICIDGDSVTLNAMRNEVVPNYNYQAYKNKLLTIYPETMFDLQIVHKGDSFTVKKDSGKVNYLHEINNPFDEKKEIIGCYCVIKNQRGEFIETLNKTEIAKMRGVAKTQFIWNAWESEMVLKSVVKRACKRHFKDIVVNIENIDNDNYDVEKTILIDTSKLKGKYEQPQD